MNKLSLAISLIAFMFIGLLMGKWIYHNPCHHNYIHALEDGRFIIVPKDSAEGKPTFTVIFEDDSEMKEMYAEEIMHGMTTGEWKYNDFLGEE